MGTSPEPILLIEDEEPDAVVFEQCLADAAASRRFDLVWVQTLAEAVEALTAGEFSAIVTDLSLPDADGLTVFTRLVSQAPSTAILILTGLGDRAMAARAVKAGAQDYLLKDDLTPSVLVRAIRYAIERQRIVSELDAARRREREERERLSREIKLIESMTVRRAAGGRNAPRPEGRMREVANAQFERFVEQYATVLQRSANGGGAREVLDAHNSEIRSIALVMAAQRARPADALDVHVAAMRRVGIAIDESRRADVAEFARHLALRLICHLASCYRGD